MTQKSAGKSVEFLDLSKVIDSLPEKFRRRYVQVFRDAVKDGLVDGLPTEGSINIRTSIFVDHVIVNDERFQDWHRDVVREFELRERKGSRVRNYREDIVNGKVDLAAQLAAYRKELKGKKPSNPKKKPKLTDPSLAVGSKGGERRAGEKEQGQVPQETDKNGTGEQQQAAQAQAVGE